MTHMFPMFIVCKSNEGIPSYTGRTSLQTVDQGQYSQTSSLILTPTFINKQNVGPNSTGPWT